MKYEENKENKVSSTGEMLSFSAPESVGKLRRSMWYSVALEGSSTAQYIGKSA